MSLSAVLFIFAFFGGLWKAFFQHPIWGLLVYTLTLYANPGFHWWGKALPNFRWSLAAAVFTLLCIFLKRDMLVPKRGWSQNGAATILIAYTIWLWIQLPWALSFSMHFGACILFTKYLVLFYMIYTIISDEKSFFLFISFNILGGLYWAKGIKEITYSGRIEGFGGPGVNDANTLGMHLGVVLVFSSLMLLKKNDLNLSWFYWTFIRLFTFLATAFIANAVVQTISRSAVLGLISAGFVLLCLNHKWFRKKFFFYAALALAGLIAMAPMTFWERLDTVKIAAEGGEMESSAFSRIVVAKAQLEMFKTNIFGTGHRGTAVLSPAYIPREYLTAGRGQEAARSSHCTFLTTLVEQGLPGAFLYWLMVLWVIKTALFFKKRDPSIYLYMMMSVASLAAIFISGIFVDYLKVEIQIYCFAMLAALKDWEMRETIKESQLQMKAV